MESFDMRKFIAGLTAATLLALPSVVSAQKAKTGPEVYATCTACHQATGLGLPGAFPPLAGSEWVNGKPEWPIAIVLHGMQGEMTVKGAKFNGMMMPWGPTFNDQEIANVVTYVRSSFGNKSAAVTAAQVAAVRAATKARKTQWTVAELKKLYP
jgi:mono/diheme cytochrome c family protein